MNELAGLAIALVLTAAGAGATAWFVRRRTHAETSSLDANAARTMVDAAVEMVKMVKDQAEVAASAAGAAAVIATAAVEAARLAATAAAEAARLAAAVAAEAARMSANQIIALQTEIGQLHIEIVQLKAEVATLTAQLNRHRPTGETPTNPTEVIVVNPPDVPVPVVTKEQP